MQTGVLAFAFLYRVAAFSEVGGYRLSWLNVDFDANPLPASNDVWKINCVLGLQH
jgi:hypothetical protein